LEPNRPASNPFFVDYYRNPRRFSFENQVAFLVESVSQHDRIRASARPGDVFVQDYSPYAHMGVYARVQRELGYLSASQLRLLDRLAAEVEPLLIPPALMVYRRVDPATALERVRNRGRPGESRVSPAFVIAIVRQFERWIRGWNRSPVVALPPEFDVMSDAIAFGRTVRLIQKALR